MDEKDRNEVATLHRQIEELKGQVSEKDAVITVLTGELIKKRMDPEYLPV